MNSSKLIVSNQNCLITHLLLGDVIFTTDPTIEYLNSESFQYMLLTTWFRNDQYVNFSAGAHFSRAIFEKPITVAVLHIIFFYFYKFNKNETDKPENGIDMLVLSF